MRILSTSKVVFIILLTLATACVPTQQFKDLQERNIKCEEERDVLFGENEALTVENTELKTKKE